MGRFYVCPKTGLKRGAWTPEEDNLLAAYVKRYGHCNWRELPKHAGLSRCGKSCRLRWLNYLRPSVKRGGYTKEEEEIIIKLHEKLGNKWSVIAVNLPGRSDNEIKNYWHCHLKKRTTHNTTTKKRKKSQNIMECENISDEADYRTSPCMGSSAPFPLSPHNSSDISEAIPDFDYMFWSGFLEMDDFPLPREASVTLSPSVPTVESCTLVPILSPNASESASSGVESLLSSEPYMIFDTDFWNRPFHLDESLVPSVESSTAVPLSPNSSDSSTSGVEHLLSSEPRLEFDTAFWNEPFHMDDLFMEDHHPEVSLPSALSESVYPHNLYNVYDMDTFLNS